MYRITLCLALAGLLLAGCGRPAKTSQFGGSPRRGASLIAAVGCGGCHAIPGIRGADGLVGPPLNNLGKRTVIAGVLPNTPENLIHWLRAPQSVVPNNVMPNMELNEHDARDIAAYLYTLR